MPLQDQAFSTEGRFGRAQLKAVIKKNKTGGIRISVSRISPSTFHRRQIQKVN